jgi:hypothetical protein
MMPISHTARVTLNAPIEEIDLEGWLFGLTDADYRACAKGHQGAGVFADERGRGMINVESIGGNQIVQHYRAVHADRGSVEMYSRASRVYLFHLVPVAAGVRWTLGVTPKGARTRTSRALSKSTSDPSSESWPDSASSAISSDAMSTRKPKASRPT